MTVSYEAVIYDLDGTLVRLDVDWTLVTQKVASRLRDRGIDTEGASLWELLERAEAAGILDVATEVVATHERVGARTAERLPAAAELPLDVPVGVCSLNAEAAVRTALERHDLLEAVEAVVGRDTLSAQKPDPEPLLALADRLDADPARTLFVGDTAKDERTADRAGMDFQYVEEWLEK
ncbi:HAD-superfamily hydrolase, subfamily IA, variant 3 [Halorhabdus utahensis DSM 12940]|uniref:HAD-superfamily hydrolase, subfamily IA, variant 3 n=1 Tax=Halorhabdus utahensis (strain DSM 12940 / JCM 11049 / AX-2) TaxID=519442 RepID=C7NPT1_HALUD|nr:HAD hydrolase-like protein [Halorhabdus utahensis]ACV10378.1 HAD-superfamily hydrolase, subfamily IA, variant 3 [Halorhabdus utahensis DSM 12940]